MKGFKLLVFLSVLFAAPHAFAQIPTCVCDTEELPNGNSGDDIVAALCPGGELAAGNDSIVTSDQVQIAGPGSDELELGYAVYYDGDDLVCSIFEETVDNLGFKLSAEEYQNCRQRLIWGCNLVRRTDIPTLSEWGMIAMAGVLGVIGLYAASRRRKASAWS